MFDLELIIKETTVLYVLLDIPCVVTSPSVPASGTIPLSVFIPGYTP